MGSWLGPDGRRESVAMSEKENLSFVARLMPPKAGSGSYVGKATLPGSPLTVFDQAYLALHAPHAAEAIRKVWNPPSQNQGYIHDLEKGVHDALLAAVSEKIDRAEGHEAFLSMVEQAASPDDKDAEDHGALSILGLESTAGAEELVKAVEAGFAPSVVESLAAAGFDRSEIDRLVVPSRTLHRRRGNGRLSPQESDAALRLARVLSTARDTFGDPENALRWLRLPNSRFEGKKPIDFLKSEAGSRYIEDYLLRADLGMTA
jgi:putative toxin-antitoxin system antitoxin component (TIGR02293 family)